MMKKILAGAGLAFALSLSTGGTSIAAEEGGAHSTEAWEAHALDWSFNGVFGTFDKAQLQRGFQVYKEVCSTCHALSLVHFRNLSDLGYNEDEVKAIAAGYQITDGPNDEGEMFQRPGIPADQLPSPFPNDQAARASNGGALPPDLSLMAKAHEAGPNYPHAILTGYREAPADIEVVEGKYYNPFFSGHWLGMPPPLSDGSVTYHDGTAATVDQMATDVSAFLMWTAEPKLVHRKETGVKVILFLVVMTGLLYAAKRKIWANLH